MKLMNNLAKLLNNQYMNTDSKFYPYFYKGELWVDDVTSSADSPVFLIKRNKTDKHMFNIYRVYEWAWRGDPCDPMVSYVGYNWSEKLVVGFFRY